MFTDVDGDYIKKPMKECTGEEITAEWLYHLGVPVEEIDELAKNHCNTTPTMMPFITAFFMPRRKGDRPDVIPDGCVNFAFLGQFAETPRDTIFTTEYSVRTAMDVFSTVTSLALVSYILDWNYTDQIILTVFLASLFCSPASFLVCQTYKGIIRHSAFTETGRIAMSSSLKV